MANNDEKPRYEDVDDMASRKEPESRPDLSTALEAFCNGVELIIQTVNRIEQVAVLDLVTCPQLDLAPGQKPPAKPVTLPHKELRIVLGMFAGRKCAVVQTNMGRECAREVKRTLHKCPRARVIIAVGVAYALNPDKVKLGDVLCSSSIYAFGNLKIVDGKSYPRDDSLRLYRIPQQLLVVFRQENWAARINFPCARIGGATRRSEVHFGSMLSWEVLLNDEEVRDELRRKYNEAVGGEMEGVELVHIQEEQADYDRQIDVVIVKGAADFANGNKDKRWQLTAAMAAAKYTEYCLETRAGPFFEDTTQVGHEGNEPESSAARPTKRPASNVSHAEVHIDTVPSSKKIRLTLDIAFKLTRNISVDWDSLGRELQVPLNYRQELRRNHAYESAQLKLEKVLDKWLAASENPTWEKLIEAMEALERRDIAREIQLYLDQH